MCSYFATPNKALHLHDSRTPCMSLICLSIRIRDIYIYIYMYSRCRLGVPGGLGGEAPSAQEEGIGNRGVPPLSIHCSSAVTAAVSTCMLA